MYKKEKKKEYSDKILFPVVNELDNSHLWEYTKERDCVFLAQSVGDTIKIYNGRDWIDFYITYDVLYHQFGKFAYTRKRCIYKNKKKKKKHH